MPTIKLTGFNTSTARIGTAGTNDDMITDGSMTIGDADTDTIIVNAEFDSDLVPDDGDTYDIGSASKKWRTGYFDQIHAKLRHVNTAKYTEGSAEQRYVRWDAAGSNGSPGVNNKFISPADGTLQSITIRATSAANSTDIAFHKATNGTENLSTTPTETQNVNMTSADTSYTVQFSGSSFSAGDILGISLSPANGFGNVNITCVWILDWNS